jgi:hypothetical protein
MLKVSTIAVAIFRVNICGGFQKPYVVQGDRWGVLFEGCDQ